MGLCPVVEPGHLVGHHDRLPDRRQPEQPARSRPVDRDPEVAAQVKATPSTLRSSGRLDTARSAPGSPLERTATRTMRPASATATYRSLPLNAMPFAPMPWSFAPEPGASRCPEPWRRRRGRRLHRGPPDGAERAVRHVQVAVADRQAVREAVRGQRQHPRRLARVDAEDTGQVLVRERRIGDVEAPLRVERDSGQKTRCLDLRPERRLLAGAGGDLHDLADVAVLLLAPGRDRGVEVAVGSESEALGEAPVRIDPRPGRDDAGARFVAGESLLAGVARSARVTVSPASSARTATRTLPPPLFMRDHLLSGRRPAARRERVRERRTRATTIPRPSPPRGIRECTEGPACFYGPGR